MNHKSYLINLKSLIHRIKLRTWISLGLIAILAPLAFLKFYSKSEAEAALMEYSENDSLVTIDVRGRYRAVLAKGDTTDYLLIYDRSQSDSSPNNTFEFVGPYINEGSTEYQLRYNNNRTTKILEVSPNRIKVRVSGCFDTSAGGACLDDSAGEPITVSEEYTFTSQGFWVKQLTDFRANGIALDNTNPEDGYNWMMVDADVTDAAFGGTIYYSNGAGAESSTATDANFEDNNTYVGFPSAGSSYLSTQVIIPQGGWFNMNGGTDDWNFDADNSGTLDRLHTRERGTTPRGVHSSSWVFRLLDEDELDSAAERQGLANDIRSFDELDVATGGQWDFTGDPALEGLWYMESDGTTGETDYSPNGNDLTVSAGDSIPTDSANYREGTASRDFTRADAEYLYITDASQTGLDPGEELTMSLWLNTSFYAASQWIAGKHNVGSFGYALAAFFVDASTVQMQVEASANGSSNTTLTGATNIRDWGWVHVAVVIEGDSEIRLYVNGLLDGVTSFSGGIFNSTADFRVGSIHATSTNTTDGNIDEVAVFSRALNHNEIRQIYNRGIAGKSFGADGSYKLAAEEDKVEADIDGGDNLATAINNAGGVNAGDTSITVDSTTGFPSSGTAYINGDKFTYTGTTATTFTGIPANGEDSVINHSDNDVVSLPRRYKPTFKIRNWQSTYAPEYVALEGENFHGGYDFISSVKPVTDSFFADELGWYSTFESAGVVTSPDVGSAGTSSPDSYVAGKYGNGALFDTNGEYISVPTSGNWSAIAGAIDFWYQPRYDFDDSAVHIIMGSDNSDGNNDVFNLFKSSSNYLRFNINMNGAGSCTADVGSGDNLWEAYEWVHIRLVWDDDVTTGDDIQIWINGVKMEDTQNFEPCAWSFASELTASTIFVGADSASPAFNANGVIDEFKIYLSSGADPSVDELANGRRYYNGYTLDFAPVDASGRGEYIYFGSEDKLTGYNVELSTIGATGGSLNLDWEYWNGTGWTSLESVSGFADGTSNFTQNGTVNWMGDPADWTVYSPLGGPDLYYVRASLNSGSGTFTTSPVTENITTDILTVSLNADVVSAAQTLSIPAGPEPLVWWKLDEGSGTEVNDAQGKNSKGSITNASWQTEDMCVSGKCLHFDGSGDYVSRADDSDFDFEAGSFSIAGWFRHPDISTSADYLFASYETTGADGGYKIYMNSDGTLTFGIDNDNSGFPSDWASSTALYDDDSWHHFTAVKNGTTGIYLYVDGHLVGSDTNITSSSLSNNDANYLGIDGDGASNGWEGYIDEFKIYPYARSAAEVKTDLLAGAGSRGSTAVAGGGATESSATEPDVHWRFDEQTGTTAYDAMENSNGSITGASWLTSGSCKLNGCLNFDAAGERVAISTANDSFVDFNGNEPFSGSAWVYVTTMPTSTGSDADAIIAKWDATVSSEQRAYRLYVENDDADDATGNFEVQIYDEGTDEVITATGPTDGVAENTWYHVAFTFNGGQAGAAGDLKLYINGVYAAQNAQNASFLGLDDVGSDFTVGEYDSDDGVSTNTAFTGYIDEVKMYSSTLSEAQVKIDYAHGSGSVFGVSSSEADDVGGGAGNPATLVWRLDENTGTTIYDTSGNGKDSTTTTNLTWTSGRYGSAISLSGTGYAARSDDNDLDFLGTDSFTLEVWFKGTDQINDMTILSKFDDTSADGGYAVELLSDGNVRCGFDTDNTSFPLDYVSTSGGGFDDGGWHHVACVKNGSSSLELYVDGEYVGIDSSITSSSIANDDSFYLGTHGSLVDHFFKGSIDNAVVYRYARSSAQIMYDYNRGVPVGWWKFDECSGTTAYDNAKNANGDAAGNNGSISIGANGTNYSAGACNTVNSSSAWYNGKSGKRSASLDFDGSDDYVDIGDTGRTDIYAVSFWVKPADTTESILQLSASDTVAVSSGTMSIGGFGTETVYIDGRQTTSFSDANWHHVTVVSDSGLTANDMDIGRVSTTYFDGQIDDVRIYNYPLTAAQIRKVMNDGTARFGP